MWQQVSGEAFLAGVTWQVVANQNVPRVKLVLTQMKNDGEFEKFLKCIK